MKQQRWAVALFVACISLTLLSSCQPRAERVRQREAQERQEDQRQLSQVLRESHKIVYQTNVDLKGLMRRDDLARPLSSHKNTLQLSSDYNEVYLVFPFIDPSTRWKVTVKYKKQLWEGYAVSQTENISTYGLDCQLLLQLGREVENSGPVEVTVTITYPREFGITPFLYDSCPLDKDDKGAATILRRNS